MCVRAQDLSIEEIFPGSSIEFELETSFLVELCQISADVLSSSSEIFPRLMTSGQQWPAIVAACAQCAAVAAARWQHGDSQFCFLEGRDLQALQLSGAITLQVGITNDSQAASCRPLPAVGARAA